MGKVNALWQDKCDEVFGDYEAGRIDRSEAIERLRALDFDRWEADAHIDALDEASA